MQNADLVRFVTSRVRIYIYIYLYICVCVFIMFAALRLDHSLFQSEFSTEFEQVLPLSVSNILPFH